MKATLIPKIKKVNLSTRTITFLNNDSYHLLYYGYLCNVCFTNQKLQEYWTYLDLQNIYVDLRKALGGLGLILGGHFSMLE